MLGLVIDTSVGACTVGLYESDPNGLTCLYDDTALMSRGHQEHIGPQIWNCFHKAGINPKALDRVCVTLGPGSFTGLRVGLSFAKGLAEGAGVRLRGFSTLEAMAAFEGLTDTRRLVVIEAGRGQVYVQAFDGMAAITSPISLNINDNEALTAYANTVPDVGVLTGNGGDHVRSYWPQALVIPQICPSTQAMARLGFDDLDRSDVKPVYIREPDAKVSDKRIVRFDTERPRA
ncbi:tRNA (adenosine(37)-N6)-threonylcarbamoyltransferase complex dimerization subunit type 1 TsaB [Asticcacaulis endophyticus]|uniref:tRNA (Adenosine(37)-N6)-threonylcarbamoyltransferase complex dimerization subunit type 1 TsaB n=1 Tax=Asticcacaulis endophyticus TaxID=1395890 RepID=A0A918UP85_9CAUL|nr:tRNA (adenosine(37)-N6)-threonylcarbamoyltransferase complex dimerization subunit type 1 TsaB [Asticcacaulis endophyticus]GGZ24555.1 tRNA (adenosine(37)-N6)-threonylcarbamoyltransferase complex dimerization subunit type 1 TsaB [Asticcacaulis endophyticus]